MKDPSEPIHDVWILRLQPAGSACALLLRDGDAEAELTVSFEDAGDVRLMVGADSLTRWLEDRGKFWAITGIRKFAEMAVRGRSPAMPARVVNTSRPKAK